MALTDIDYYEVCALADKWTELPPTIREMLARQMGSTVDSLTRHLQIWRKHEAMRKDAEEQGITKGLPANVFDTAPDSAGVTLPDYPESPSPTWDDYTEIECDNAVIIADVELPDYDVTLMKAAHAVGMQHGIKTLIIGGDFTALDSVSSWATVYRSAGAMGLLQELVFATRVLESAFTWFDNIYAIMGNHEWRLGRALDGQLGPYDVIKTSAGEVIVKPYDYMYLNTSRGRVKVIHPKNYSRTPLAVPRNVIAVEEPRCHILSTHTHHSASGLDPSGHYELMEIGCLRDPLRTQYKQQHQSNHPQWVQGFAVIKDGWRYRLTKYHTNWHYWLGDSLCREVFGAMKLEQAA